MDEDVAPRGQQMTCDGEADTLGPGGNKGAFTEKFVHSHQITLHKWHASMRSLPRSGQRLLDIEIKGTVPIFGTLIYAPRAGRVRHGSIKVVGTRRVIGSGPVRRLPGPHESFRRDPVRGAGPRLRG